MGLMNQDGTRFLVGGDDGGVTQQTYTITQTFLLSSAKLDATRIALGKITGRFQGYVGWADVSASAATVILDFLDNSNAIVGTITVFNNETSPTAPTWGTFVQPFTVPVTATKIKLTLQARSPVGDGAANVAFDGLKFYFYDAERPVKDDPLKGFGSSDTIWNTSPGSYTFDEFLIWKATEAFVKYDVVASVTDRKTFAGTNIAGATGIYETAAIQWISGDNAGLRNLIRTWDPLTKTLKLAFRSAKPIQVGDRFMYVRACQRRFLEDCKGVFGNQINFRGFPHVPGKLENMS